MEYYDIVKQITSPNGRPPFSDNNLINGKANFNCSNAINPAVRCYPNAGISKFLFTPGKTHRLRLINSGAEATQRFSIDEHTMTVITNDFTPIEPYDTKVVTLGVGQRADVLVKAKDCQETQKGRKAFWIRSNITCSDAKQPYGLAALYYDGADTSVDPDSIPWDMPDPKTCANDDLVITKPLFKMKLPEPSFTMHMDISVRKNASNVTHFLMDVSDCASVQY